MNPLEPGLLAIVSLLERERFPYMVIGGVAVAAWGAPRFTKDVDVTAWALDRETDLTRLLIERFAPAVPDPAAFAAKNRFLPVTADGTRVDVMYGAVPFERRAIERAAAMTISGRSVKVCSPEDLIVHKVIAGRDLDRHDARELIRVRGPIDRSYLDPIIRNLADALARPGLWTDYLALFKR